MIEPMSKIHVIGHRSDLDLVLDALYRVGAVHLIDVTDDSSVPLPPLTLDAEHQREIEEARYLKARIDGVLALASHRPAAPEEHFDAAQLERVRSELDAATPEIERLVARLDELEQEQQSLPRHLASLRRLLPLVPELVHLESYETVAILIDRRYASVLGELNAELSAELGGNYEIISDQVDADTVGAVLVFPKAAANQVHALLGREQVTRLRLPGEYERVPFRVAIARMEQRLRELPAEIANVKDRLDRLISAHQDWAAASEYLASRIDQLGAVAHLGATPHTFVLSGWVPRARMREVRAALAGAAPDAVLEEVPPAATERPPVLMHNPAPARPFEFLVRLLAVPRYGSIDPTGLMMLFMPLFVGMMVGDIAYGVVMLGLALWALRWVRGRSPVIRDLARVFVLSAGWSIVWGFIYGELLGDLGHRVFGLEPLWISREDAVDLDTLLIFSVAVGAVHVVLGLVLGLWEAYRIKDRRTASERAAMLLALIGLFTIAGAASGMLGDGVVTPAVAAVIVGTAILIALGGAMGVLMGPLELIGAVGNVLSYLRIAAIGLASVYLARVANELGVAGPVWLGVIVAALFHALNLVLAAFSPTIQALRLHYVEFFGKFLQEGGTPYRPFGPDDDSAPSERPTVGTV